jgi:transposase-like protein
MRGTVRKEEPMSDSLNGIYIDAEGVRSGGELGVLGTVKSGLPDPEVPAKASRRRFSAQYKKNILEEAEACKGAPGAIGALLRREGLYSSHLTTWKKQREKAELEGLSPKKRGRKAKTINPLSGKVKSLESEIRRLQGKLENAETIIAFQKKLSEMLGINLKQEESDRKC